MVDMQLLIYAAIGTGVLAALALIGSHADRIIAALTAQWAIAIAHGRAQKARRERAYGYVLSSDEAVLDPFGTGSVAGSAGSGEPVLRQQNQSEPAEPDAHEPALRQLGKEELIILLAVQRNEDGAYRYSANQITAFVGGAAAPIKETIATVRGRKEAPKPGAPLKRPVNGW